jgi:hypothetical protein
MIRINGVDKPSTRSQASNEAHGVYRLADNPNLYEPQRSNNFEFVVTDIDNIVRAGMKESDAGAKIANAQEVLRLSVSEAAVPHFSQGDIEIRRGNNSMHFAGTPTFDSGSFNFTDYIGADTISILMAWQNLSYDVNTEKVGLVTDYKKDAYLIEYTPDWQKVRQYILKGCWIKGISEPSLNFDSNEKRTISATILYDYAKLDTSEM